VHWPRLRFLKGRMPQTVNEVLGYCWTPENQRTGKGGDKDMDVDDHCMDALRYFAASCPLTKVRAESDIVRRAVDPLTGMPLDTLRILQAGGVA
jgi:hypothetical protein